MDIKCQRCGFVRLELGPIASEAYAIKHSLKHSHPVDVINAGTIVKTFGEDRTIPMTFD